MTIKQQAIAELMAKYPHASTIAIARMAYNQNKELFVSKNAASLQASRMRGKRGSKMSKSDIIPRKSAPMPEGKTQLRDWSPVVMEGPMRVLVLSDVHIPYHDRSAVEVAIGAGRKQQCDTILLNGDIADFFSISRWEKDPRQRNFTEEIKTVNQFLSFLRGKFPKAAIRFKLGNHEERLESYMRLKAPELLGIEALELSNLLQLKDIGADVIEQKRPVQLGELNVIHGHEYRFAISNPVNPARGLFLRCKSYALCGHFHQSSYHSEKTVKQNVLATWSTGCLCDLHPEYLPMNNWSHGFAIVEVDKRGKFNVQNKVIKGSSVY